MMATLTDPPVFETAEPLPGYRIQERIGAGGYGEVWRAEAPGGIAKAVKVIYGRHDDQRAQRELSALNRIKQVRHPFLLSLERIELVGGHLVIVTELASSSLKSLFEQYRQSGLLGIPRQELLAHLGDAADALDYIAQEHSLQHLDVKPENLLLVGGRVKVADFGLVKDLQDVHSSIVGGLTPVYAAPELFDGRPALHSDQYSLAIVYQEMLTGSLPYEGRTTAQLAAQHLHSRPQLDSLPPSDRDIVERALSKNSTQRFPSCRHLVASLAQAGADLRSPPASVAPLTHGRCRSPSRPVPTEVITPESIRAGGAKAADRVLTQPVEPAPVVSDLPPLALSPEDVVYRPTLFVGIGGLAGQTLQMLHGRLVNRFGDLGAVPAVQILLFETDVEALKAATEGGGPAQLPNDAAILLPLRQPADYRQQSESHLEWLSRRWIYNIPRNLQTQGLRPLGRLAFIDHLERVRQRLSRAIREATDVEGLAASARKTSLPFQPAAPRVFLVSSISGGTGSGMALDVAYLVRGLLGDLGLSDEGLCGVLAHCSGRNQQGRELAVANAYAFLTELRHYSHPGHAYPGDPLRGLPAFESRKPPFGAVYLLHLGEDLEPAQFTAAADKLAKYLYCSAMTPAQTFFDQCRTRPPPAESSAADEPTARSFGVAQLGFSYDDIPATVVNELCKTVVTRWRGTERPPLPETPRSLADPTALLASHFTNGVQVADFRWEAMSHLEAVELTLPQLIDSLHAVAAGEMGDDPESYLLAVLVEIWQSYPSRLGNASRAKRLPLSATILDALDALMHREDANDAQCVCLESVLEGHLKEVAARQAAALREWLLGLVGQPNYRVAGAQQMADCLAECLRAFSHQAGKQSQDLLQQRSLLRQTLLEDKNGGRDWLRFRSRWRGGKPLVDRRLSQYFCLRIGELTLNAVCRLNGLILGSMAGLGDRLRKLSADLNRVVEKLATPPQGTVPMSVATTPGDQPSVGALSGPDNGAVPLGTPQGGLQGPRPDPAAEVHRSVAAMIELDKAELVAEMDHDLAEDLGRLVAAEEEDIPGKLLPALHRTARLLCHRLLKKLAVQKITASTSQEPQEASFSLRAGLEAVRTPLANCGGARRLLLVVPGDMPSAELARHLSQHVSQPPTVVADQENEVLVCCELEQVPIRQVAAAVAAGRMKTVEVAARLHTRIDVPWWPL